MMAVTETCLCHFMKLAISLSVSIPLLTCTILCAYLFPTCLTLFCHNLKLGNLFFSLIPPLPLHSFSSPLSPCSSFLSKLVNSMVVTEITVKNYRNYSQKKILQRLFLLKKEINEDWEVGLWGEWQKRKNNILQCSLRTEDKNARAQMSKREWGRRVKKVLLDFTVH